jgi:hypothetical protein
MEAGNRLAGITAVCERRIGQELRRMPSAQGRRTDLLDGVEEVEAVPTRAELGISYDQSAAYQELAHPDVAENVILDAIATASRSRRRSRGRGGARSAGAEIDLRIEELNGATTARPSPPGSPGTIRVSPPRSRPGA